MIFFLGSTNPNVFYFCLNVHDLIVVCLIKTVHVSVIVVRQYGCVSVLKRRTTLYQSKRNIGE